MDEPIDVTDHAPGPAEIAARREQSERIAVPLAQLPEHYRRPLLLHYFHGFTVPQVAAALERPENTIAGQMARGRQCLAPLLKKRALAKRARRWRRSAARRPCLILQPRGPRQLFLPRLRRWPWEAAHSPSRPPPSASPYPNLAWEPQL